MMESKDLKALLEQRTATMKQFVEGHEPICCYAIFRADLGMTPGKMAAQCGHAFDEVIMKSSGDEILAYKGTGHGTKIIMYVKNEHQLVRCYEEAKALGITTALVVDRGHVIPNTMFTGAPILTAVGIGPVKRSLAAPITKRCTMVQ